MFERPWLTLPNACGAGQITAENTEMTWTPGVAWGASAF